MNTALRRLAGAEEGVAIVVAIGALSVLLVLSAFAFAAASQLGETSSADRSSRGAFQTAEGGLEVAIYRVNNLIPLLGEGDACVPGETAVGEGGAGGCRDSGLLGGGESWSYEVTPRLTPENHGDLLPGGKCAGFPIQFEGTQDLALESRCITATGTANGETRRVQARLALFTGVDDPETETDPTLFPVDGIVGLSGIYFHNSVEVEGDLGSNGLIDFFNAVDVYGNAVLGPGAPPPETGFTSDIHGSVDYRSVDDGDWVLAPVDIGDTATSNDNGDWTLDNATYDADGRELEINHNGGVVFHGGDYNLCKVDLNNKATFDVPPGAQVRMFIDSPDREGSGCDDDSGYFKATNAFTLDADESQAAFQLYVYGADPDDDQPAVELHNAAEVHALIHAPLATVQFTNAIDYYGAINADYVDVTNAMDFRYPDEGISGLTGSDPEEPENGHSLFQRSAWRECRPQPTGSSAHSGC